MNGSEYENPSDEEIEGVEMDDDCNDGKENGSTGESDELIETIEDGPEEVADGEDEELYEVCQERMKLMEAERAKVLNEVADAESRLQYLLAQSDVFAHFLAGSVAAAAKKNKRKAGSASGGGRSGGERMSEADEDAALVETAQSKRKVVRLDRQPSILAPHCKMHPYQLEGLNWLIKLHDHGINGEMVITELAM
jgi:SWI/SNF-related matrix-associated actin-dependent regulator of chromatin subfamily A member 5